MSEDGLTVVNELYYKVESHGLLKPFDSDLGGINYADIVTKSNSIKGE